MDALVLAIMAVAGICSFAFCTMRQRAPFSLSLFAWLFAIPWLSIYAIRTLWSLNNIQLVSWTGQHEIGPLTLILAVLGLSLVTMGGASGKRV